VENELRVDEAIFFWISGRAEKKIGLGLLVGESNSCGAVGEATVRLSYHELTRLFSLRGVPNDNLYE